MATTLRTRPKRRAQPGSRSTARWLASRAQQLVVTVVIIVLVAFAMVHLLPGDPAVTILGVQATPQSLHALREQLHLNDSLLGQLGAYLGGLIHGDLGGSIVQQGRSVATLIFPALGVTMWIVLLSIVASTVLAIPIGLAAARTRRHLLDLGIRIGSVILVAIPPFVVGLVLLLLVALKLGAAPTGGWAGDFLGDWAYLWLPTIALVAHLLPTLILVVRESVLETTQQSFVEAATSRGLPRHRVLVSHITKNSLLPLITVVGLNIGGLIGFTVVVETVFSLPGIGALLLSSVFARDYPVIQGIVIVTALITVLGNFVADVFYRAVDPRTRSMQ